MNDDRYLRSNKDLEKVGCKGWPKEVKEQAIHGLSPVSKWLLRTKLSTEVNMNNCVVI